MVDEREQCGRSDDINLAGPDGFAALGGGADKAELMLGSMKGGEQHARYRAEAAIESKFTYCEMPGEHILRQHVHGNEQGECYGQIEMRAFLGQVCGREIYDDAARRQ